MRRLLLAALAASTTMTFAVADDEKAKPKSVPATPIKPAGEDQKADDKKADDKKDDKDKTRKERLADLQKELAKKRQEMVPEINAAMGEERQKLINQYMGLGSSYAKQMLDLAKEDAKDEASLPAAIAAMQNAAQPTSKTAKDAVDYITDNFADSDKLVPLIPMLANGDPSTVEKLAAKSTKKEIKGPLLFSMISNNVDKLDYPVPLPIDEATNKFAEAKSKLVSLAAEYGDVKITDRLGKTVGEAAKAKEFFIDNLTVGKKAPDFECELLDDKKAKLSNFKGQVVVLDIWATWCGPCKAMIPHERELVEKLKDKSFKLISVSADAKKETLTQFLENEKMPWTHFWNGGAKGNMLDTYQVRFYPTIFVIDGKGVIRFKHVRGAKMDAAVESLLKESAE